MSKIEKKKVTYRILLTCCVCLFSRLASAQTDTLLQVYNYTYKNIVSFNLYNEMRSSKDVSKGFSYLPFYSYYLPDKGYSLEMKIEKTSLTYPLTDFKLYEVNMDGFVFKNSDKNATKKAHVNAPTGSYLVAYNAKTKSIKFIAGHFFYTPIQEDFELNPSNPATYAEFIKLKMFTLRLSDITCKRKERKTFVFESYSAKLDKIVKIKLSLNDVENPTIIN